MMRTCMGKKTDNESASIGIRSSLEREKLHVFNNMKQLLSKDNSIKYMDELESLKGSLNLDGYAFSKLRDTMTTNSYEGLPTENKML